VRIDTATRSTMRSTCCRLHGDRAPLQFRDPQAKRGGVVAFARLQRRCAERGGCRGVERGAEGDSHGPRHLQEGWAPDVRLAGRQSRQAVEKAQLARIGGLVGHPGGQRLPLVGADRPQRDQPAGLVADLRVHVLRALRDDRPAAPVIAPDPGSRSTRLSIVVQFLQL